MNALNLKAATRVQVATLAGLGALAILLTRLALLDYASSSALFHPHGYCYLWQPGLVSAHVISDAVIGLSYIAISATLIYLVWRARRLLPFSWIFVAFGVFIIACGATHLMEIWTLWSPVFWLSADTKIVTAIASVATAIVLPPLLPKVLHVVQAAHVSEQRRVDLEHAHAELERRVAERTAQLQAALERAEDAVRTKETFLSTVSHELRTPLNAILGWSRMLNAGPADQAFIRRGLSVIDRNATIQTQLVEDLLDMSRLAAGTLQLRLEPVDLVRVVADALEVVRPAADAKGVIVSVAHQQPHATLTGEPRRLQQIVWNLLSNAVKFTPRGGGVTVAAVQRDGNCVLEVRDTGIGIERSFIPHLFERFTQADTSTTREYQGVGLGLAITRQLVELHGGSISAHSEGPGRGSVFVVTLPVRTAVETASDSRGASALQTSTDLHGIRVLVVDDDTDAREALALMLARSGASVKTAASADEALAELRSGAFDVLLSDLAMPSRDGYDLIRRVRQAEDDRVRRLPAIAVSAFAREEERTRAIACGFHIHVAKPVTPEELVGAVSALLSQ
jgi:signal transduction histidine kinase/ActR/RegA family two-component response regulator